MVWYLKPWPEAHETFLQSLLLPAQINVFLSLLLLLISAAYKLWRTKSRYLFAVQGDGPRVWWDLKALVWMLVDVKKKPTKKEKGEQVLAGWCTTRVIFLLFEVEACVFLACGCSRLGVLQWCFLAVSGWRTLLLPHKPSPASLSNVSYVKEEDNKSRLKFLQDFDVLLHAGVVETHSKDQHCTKREPQEHRQSRWWPVICWTVMRRRKKAALF